ncbi:MAG TPA: bifunctional phosphoribosyl-AMP cyclohydrolase/phosphoribosyl-ATP diphosphatase HisIE [Epulopiscium sp.]|nr:bifunctional phosphoribosyl-AMP cyclohydrolase/phosphoribosyl-ATP diphosphatase HisIE [Candidatus Epulonipiscium sp.]
MTNILKEIKWDDKGLVAVIVQDAHSKKVRMMAYMNEEALTKTIETGRVYYYSRSRQELWEKGETSGYFQLLRSISIDCDGDALLLQIEQVGGISCHTGNHTCFYRTIENDNWKEEAPVEVASADHTDNGNMVSYVYGIIADRKENPKEGSYTNYLLSAGIDKILKKVGEEATEVIIASKNDDKAEVIFEVSDLLFHLSVLMLELGVTWDDVYQELAKRK